MLGLTKEKRSLFGGALRCAGLVAAASTTAGAMADFVPYGQPQGYNPNIQSTYATSLFMDSHFNQSVSGAAEFLGPFSYSNDGMTLNTYATSTAIGFSVSLTSLQTWNYASAGVAQWFTVDSGVKKVEFTWDLTGVAPGAGASIHQLGVGTIGTFATGGTSGSETLLLSAGNVYRFNAGCAFDGVLGSGFAYIRNVPAPGALALLGVGMLGTRRRRRT